MTNWRSLLWILPVGFISWWLLNCDPDGDARSVTRPRERVDVIREQLADLASLVRDYKEKHGFFPSNDDGLAALDGFEERIKVPFLYSRVRGLLDDSGSQFGRFYPRDLQKWVEISRGVFGDAIDANDSDILKMLVKDAQRVGDEERGWCSPAELAEFENVPGSGASAEPGLRPAAHPDSLVVPLIVELGKTKSGALLPISPSGVYSPWLLPFVYENRTGFRAEAFSDSPANSDPGRYYSVQVADGIYVYAVGGREAVDRWRAAWRDYYWPKIVGLALLGLTLVVILVRVRPWKRLAVAVAALGLFAAAGVKGVCYTTCYLPRSLFHYPPRRELVATQRGLLDRYRAAGIISAEAYAKAVAALDPARMGQRITEAGTAPTTAPDGAK